MFFASLLFLCMHTIVFSADKQASITLLFVDNENKTLEIAKNAITWSNTITQLVDDLPNEQAIPVHNVSQENCTLLKSLMMKDAHNPLDYTNKTACELKKFFKNAALQKTCTPLISKPQFLIETNYLDIPKNCLRALTFFYACTIENPTITFNNEKIVFDNLPHELEPYIAGWVSKNTLKLVRPEILRYPPDDLFDNISVGTIVSNCADDGSFAGVYQLTKKNMWPFVPMGASTKVCIIDQNNSTHHIHDLDVTGDLKNALCTLSSNKKNLLLITTTVQSTTKAIQIYDLDEKGMLNPTIYHTTHSIIKNALFNHESKKFTVIAADEKDNLEFMTIDPTQKNAIHVWYVYKKPDFCTNSTLSWSCVQGYVVGIDGDNPTHNALLYTGSELVECTSESADPLTLQATVNGKKITINYGIIRDYLSETNYKKNYHASKISYIPNMAKAMPKFGFLDYKHISPFDVQNACVNIIHDKKAITINRIPRKLNQILHLCSNKLHAGDTNVLPYAYAAYCYYKDQKMWKTTCAAFLAHTPEITKIFE